LYEYALVSNEVSDTCINRTVHKRFVGECYVDLFEVWKRHVSSIESNNITADIFSSKVTCHTGININRVDAAFDADGALVESEKTSQVSLIYLVADGLCSAVVMAFADCFLTLLI